MSQFKKKKKNFCVKDVHYFMLDFAYVNNMCVNSLEFDFTQFKDFNRTDVKKTVIMHNLKSDYVENSSQFFNYI